MGVKLEKSEGEWAEPGIGKRIGGLNLPPGGNWPVFLNFAANSNIIETL